MSDLAKTQLPSTNTLILERQGSVLKIWFNRPEAKNALNAEMTDELVNVLTLVKDDRSIRTIVLRGKGGFFCAGGDIKGFKSGMQTVDAAEVAKSNRSFGDVMSHAQRATSGGDYLGRRSRHRRRAGSCLCC